MTTTDKRKKPQKRARDPKAQELVRQSIIESARTLFHENGVDQVSMRKIATDCGYSVGTLYLYFSNKRELLNELWMEDLELLHNTAIVISQKSIEPIDKLNQLCVSYIEYWVSKPDHYKIGFGSVLEGENAGFKNAEDQIEKYRMVITTVVEDAKAKGQLRNDADTTEILHTIVAASHGVLAVHYSLSIIRVEPMAYGRLMVDTILKGWQ